MRYHFAIFRRAVILHFLRWNRYRADVFVWVLTIWTTLGIQAIFLFVTYSASGGNFFGYTAREVRGFFGMTLLTCGIAQSLSHGTILSLSKAVWSGNMDHWLLQPPRLLVRIMTEELGIIWYWPHIVVGSGIILYSFPFDRWIIAFMSSFIAGAIEMAIVLLFCLPAIRWGRWNPYEGLWEYFENARSIPIGRTRNMMLWIASFGVLQYSLALEVVTGGLSLLTLLLIAACAWAAVFLLLKVIVLSYGSASS